MVQTLTVWSNGIVEINTGTNFHLCDGSPFSPDLDAKIDEIQTKISADGVSQLHVERDTFRQFEHIVKAGKVYAGDFGETVSPLDFDWIMQHVDDAAPDELVPGFEFSEPTLL
jgi:hypothetical protein